MYTFQCAKNCQPYEEYMYCNEVIKTSLADDSAEVVKICSYATGLCAKADKVVNPTFHFTFTQSSSWKRYLFLKRIPLAHFPVNYINKNAIHVIWDKKTSYASLGKDRSFLEQPDFPLFT